MSNIFLRALVLLAPFLKEVLFKNPYLRQLLYRNRLSIVYFIITLVLFTTLMMTLNVVVTQYTLIKEKEAAYDELNYQYRILNNLYGSTGGDPELAATLAKQKDDLKIALDVVEAKENELFQKNNLIRALENQIVMCHGATVSGNP